MNTYPRDEFDAVPEAPRRQGVHRTRGESSADSGRTPSGRGLRWILAAGILALVIGAVSFFVLPRLGLPGEPAAASAATSPAPSSARSTPAPSTSAPGKQSASPSQAPSSAAAGSTPTASAPAGADQSLEVGVYNATSTAGLGNRVAATARSAGWTVSTVGNWSGSPVDGPVVYYRSAEDAASAKALAAEVGVPTVLEAPALGLPLAVVIGPGYTG
ncbi:cytoskeletal protein RodZ [Sinomonas atrocyanea]|uniref:LytR C-terminal domain-containing protein n=1 Tax=Sinomonas atrocyanea TaxID=37927 RepID=UPI002780D6FE|nr:LytR C-terminal domain-containing protein [Sinomonas atrocyanea]MDP9886328.1 cytoskeletal protein RodZ [Sinomonas atrocyanea]